jgi:hypothetical protein
VRIESSPIRTGARDLAWIAVPFLAYLALLQLLWFNAPVWDDFEVLDGTVYLMGAHLPAERLAFLFSQHNEHRIVVTRALAWAAAELAGGRVDFRVLTLIGNLALAGLLVLFWAEFRHRVDGWVIAASGFILCQLTYFQGALLSMAAISNIGVIAFAFAALRFSMHPGSANLGWALAFGLLAAGSQGNGLFVLPLAAIGCALRGARHRAWLFAGVAIVTWILYLATYHRPPNHPSVLEALRHPVDAIHLFVVFVGGLAPGVGPATVFGALLLGALGWLVARAFWKEQPAVALWIAFIMLSAAAAAASRVGFGVFHASRYAINSSALTALVFLLLAASRRWTPQSSRNAFLAAAAGSLALSWLVWPDAAANSAQGRLLAKAIPATPDVRSDAYFGVAHPGPHYGIEVLTSAEVRGLYRARPERVFASATRHEPGPPPAATVFGHVDLVQVAGPRVTAVGWTDVTAQAQGRVFVTYGPEAPREARVTATSRSDLAPMAPRLVFGGFRWEAEYTSPEQAARAAQALCLQLEGPGLPARRFAGNNPGCAGTGSR